MNESKEKELRLEHSLQMRRIWLEKALTALTLIILGLVINKSVEKFKSNELKDRIILENKIEAVKELRSLYSENSDRISHAIEMHCSQEQFQNMPVAEDYEEKINEFNRLLVTNSALLKKITREVGHSLVNLYYGATRSFEGISCDHRLMLSDVGSHYSYLLRKDLGTVSDEDSSGFYPVPTSSYNNKSLTAQEFMNHTFSDWKKTK